MKKPPRTQVVAETVHEQPTCRGHIPMSSSRDAKREAPALCTSRSRGFFSSLLGAFIGSALWWLILSSGADVFRTKFNLRGLRWVNRISGMIITGFGLLALLSLRG